MAISKWYFKYIFAEKWLLFIEIFLLNLRIFENFMVFLICINYFSEYLSHFISSLYISLKYLNIIKRINMEFSLCKSSHKCYFLSMWSSYVLIHWSKIDLIFIVRIIWFKNSEFYDEWTIILKIWRLYKLFVERSDICFNCMMLW
jgi:hypothetical protein